MKDIALEEITLWPKNYRLGDVGAIRESILRFGFNQAVRVRTESGKLVVYAGNHAIKALTQIRDEGKEPPTGITNDWRVPVLFIDHLNEKEAEAYAIADNRTSELGQIDEEQLASILAELAGFDQSLALSAGYSEDDLNKLLESLNELPQIPVDEDELPPQRRTELQEKWKVQEGDVYQIGPHVLMCGNSESTEHFDKLYSHVQQTKKRTPMHPWLMVTDPPYGVSYDADWRIEAGKTGGEYATGSLKNDDRVDWSAVYKLWEPEVLYAWHGGLHAAEVAISIKNAGYEIRSQIIWVKPTLVFSRGHYHWKHEPCYYAVRKGASANWQGSRNETTVWECGNGSACGRTGDEADEFHAGHPSQKPVELFRKAILNHTTKGQWVAEPFAGSGSCLVACHVTGRRCMAMELDPEFCAVILERFELLGVTPERI